MDRSVHSPVLEHQRYIHERGEGVHSQQINRVIQFPAQIHAKRGIFSRTIRVLSDDRGVLEVNIQHRK